MALYVAYALAGGMSAASTSPADDITGGPGSASQRVPLCSPPPM